MTLEDIDKSRVPQHVAIIMDGNGRWAQRQQQQRLFGHQHASTAIHHALEASIGCGVKYLTLYTFSTENWNRPKEEVEGLMELLVQLIQEETQTLMDYGVRLRVIGDTGRLPKKSHDKLMQCIETTANNGTLTLILALSYSARWEVSEALKQISKEVGEGLLRTEEINEETLRRYLATKEYPDPDLLIRTGGELRISNFLLWQMAYTELYFTEVLWPDFRHEDYYEAVVSYQRRQRRYGKTGEQVKQTESK